MKAMIHNGKIYLTPRAVSRRRRPATPTPAPFLTLDAAAALVGLSPRSLLNRIHASGGKKMWSQCGRLPGKTPMFDRAAFVAWFNSPANRSPLRTAPPKRSRR